MKKHERWLTFIGAFIVFTTFIVKEGLRDYWQDTAEGIETAEYFYELHAEARFQDDELRRIKFIVTEMDNGNRVDDEATDGKTFATSKRMSQLFDVMSEEFALGSAMAEHVKVQLSDLDRLAEKLSNKDSARQDLIKRRREIENFEARISELNQLVTKYSQIKIGPRDEKSIYGMLAKRFFEISRVLAEEGLEHPPSAYEPLAAQMLNEAKLVKDTNARRSRYAWWISTCLFSLGWGLGLLGKLYGVAEASPGE